MKKILIMGTLLSTLLLWADTSLGTPIGKQPTKIKKAFKKVQKHPNKTFKKDHHKFDKRYSNFNYDRYGYYNDDGYYYGYFDRRGYFFDNIYFEYNSRYTYEDRLHVRGYFGPRHSHLRPYRYHAYNNWNRVHCHHQKAPLIVHQKHYASPRYYYPPANRHDHHLPRDNGHIKESRFNEHRIPTQRDHQSQRRDSSPTQQSHLRDNGHLSHERFNKEKRSYQRQGKLSIQK